RCSLFVVLCGLVVSIFVSGGEPPNPRSPQQVPVLLLNAPFRIVVIVAAVSPSLTARLPNSQTQLWRQAEILQSTEIQPFNCPQFRDV
ncbi:hypothetical protein EDC04DRAFT_2625872, partial [Pisolithus marmoratus]